MNSLHSSVGSACDSLLPDAENTNSNNNNNNDNLAIVPSSPVASNKSNLILGKLYSSSSSSSTAPETSSTSSVPDASSATPTANTTPKKNLIKENIEKIKEHVSNSENYARTEIEQVHRPCGVHTIGRNIQSAANKESLEAVKKDLNVERGVVSRAKEGN